MTRDETMRKLCKELFGNERARPAITQGHDTLTGRRPIHEVIRDVIESAHQAEADLCGDQRAFHLPRLKRAEVDLMKWFPLEYYHAFVGAVDAWGDKLVS